MQKVVVSLLGILLLAGCAGGAATPTPTPAPVEVTVTLTEFGVETSQTTFEAGKTYRFVVTNNGVLNHEFMIMPPVEDSTAVATEEAGGMDMGNGNDNMDTGEEGMSMEEMDAMALAMIEEENLPPGTTQTVEVTFDKAAALGELEFACHVPGHYAAGMKQPIEVN